MLSQGAYNDRLNRVLDYVHAHLEDELSFDRMAEVACLSPYHWSRIYSAMRGETIVATIRRLRLQRAAERLSNTDLDLATVALRAGYGSADAFGRAFKEAFGLSPAIYRAQGSHAAFKAACVAGDAQAFPVEIVSLPEQRCAGMDHIGSYMGIDHAMGRLFGELAARGTLPAEPVELLIPDVMLRKRRAVARVIKAPIQEPLAGVVEMRFASSRHDGMAPIIDQEPLAFSRTDDGLASSRPPNRRKAKPNTKRTKNARASKALQPDSFGTRLRSRSPRPCYRRRETARTFASLALNLAQVPHGP